MKSEIISASFALTPAFVKSSLGMELFTVEEAHKKS